MHNLDYISYFVSWFCVVWCLVHSGTINKGVPKDEALVLSFMEHDLMLIAEILYFLLNDILVIN